METMSEKRFKLDKDCEWWTVEDNTIKVNEFGYREDLTGEDKYRGLRQELTEQETVDLLNKFHEENNELKEENKQLKGFFKKLKKSGYWTERYLIEQDWDDLKNWIELIGDFE